MIAHTYADAEAGMRRGFRCPACGELTDATILFNRRERPEPTQELAARFGCGLSTAGKIIREARERETSA